MFTIPVLDIKSDPLDALLAVVGYRLVNKVGMQKTQILPSPLKTL